MKQLRKLFLWYVVVPVLVLAVAGGVMFGIDLAQNPSNSGNANEETTISNPTDPAIPVSTDTSLPVLQSGLEITRLELSDYGSRLIRGSTFSILVQVTNQGQSASGEYTVEIWRQLDLNTFLNAGICGADESLGMKTMMDSYTMGSLAPGETYTIEKEDALLDFEAWYDISAEITPIGWQENNKYHHVESLWIDVGDVWNW